MGKIKPRDRDAIIQALHFGTSPRIGIQHIAVGRSSEVEAIIQDLDRIKNDGNSIKFVIGRFGSGKSFFLTLSSDIAISKKFVVAHADVTQERLLHSPESKGKARALYSELMRNLSIKAKWEGGALRSIVEGYISGVETKLRKEGKDERTRSFERDVIKFIYDDLTFLQDFVGGSDFSLVLGKYFEGYQSCNDELMDNAIKWLSGEYTTKLQANKDLGVRTFIDDNNYYNYLKLWAKFFVKKAGYSGFLITLDEMGTISQNLNHGPSREANYKMLLDIVNNCVQGGSTTGIGFIFAGTEDFLDDSRRGIASYPALDQRIRENSIEKSVARGVKDCSGPLIRLDSLSKEETMMLLINIRNVFAYDDSEKYPLTDKELEKFLHYYTKTLGYDQFSGPREITKGFIKALSLLEKDPKIPLSTLLGDEKVVSKKPAQKFSTIQL